jgi:hypothetical protein
VSDARVHETIFRHSARGREALAPPGEGGSHVHYEPRRSVGLGCITSRRQPELTFFERLALELGVNLATAKQMWQEGKVQ